MSYKALMKAAALAGAIVLLLSLMAVSAWGYSSSDIDWEEYPSDPVYVPASNRAYYPCVLYDENQFSSHGASYYYKMWYADTTSTPYQYVVYSNDGINWENAAAVTGIAPDGYHAKVLYVPSGYGAGPYYYKIWYWDNPIIYSIDALRTADSSDGVNWVSDQALTQDATYPLITGVSPDWNRGSYGPAAMLYNSSASNTGGDPFDYSYTMYYDGTTGGEEVIGLGYSADGNHWIRFGNDPVLGKGAPGSWDSDYVTNGTVIPGADGVWRMWYSGSGPAGGGNEGIGYATSSDGINWARDPDNPLISINDGVAWRDVRTYTPSVLYSPSKFDGHGDACLYKMWFTGRTNTPSTTYAIGYMTSEDPTALLSLQKSASPGGEVNRGSVIVYTLRARNDGGAPATACTLADSIPAYTGYVANTTTLNGTVVPDVGGTTPLASGMIINSPGEPPGIIAAGEEGVVTFTVQVGNDLPLGGSISNVATVQADGITPIEADSDNPAPPGLPATWYFAEGSTQPGFDEYILLSNMGDTDMVVTITYITEGSAESDFQYLVPAHSRSTVYVNSAMPGQTGVAAIVTGEAGLICERSMYYLHNGIAGGDDVIGANAPSVDLFFAEGFTGTPESPFEEWLLILNPNPDTSNVTVDYLFPGGETTRKEYSVPGRRRISIYVDGEVGEGREVSARILSELPVVGERAMYFVYNGMWPGGHNGMAATAACSDWYLAEGYTGWEGSEFDEWILVANDNDQPATVTVTYMFPDGSTQAVEHTAAPHSRLTASADAEVGRGQMVSAHIHADVPIVVERAMYFDYRDVWDGGHNCLGATVPAKELYFAEGYTGNSSSQFETWVLIQNTADEAKAARVDYILMSGEVVSQELDLPAHSRNTVYANQVLGLENLEFSIRITSKDGTPVLLAERAMYFSYNGPMGGSQGGSDAAGY